MKRFALVILALALVGNVLAAQDLERLFKAAVNTETVDRNPKAAIEQYKKVAAGSNRALAAQALLRMADCYRQLGDVEAQKIYRRLVTEFSDQKEPFAIAQQRLGTRTDTSVARSDLSLRRVHSGVNFAAVSPDARWAVFDEFNTAANGVTGADLVLLDLRSGARRVLDKHPGTGAYIEHDAVFSPDGSQVAYHMALVDNGNNHEIRIVHVDGNSAPRIVYESRKSNTGYVFVKGWTPDGRRLLISPERNDGIWQLAMVSIADGTVQTVKSFSWSQVHAALSPDGRYIAYAAHVRDDDVTRDLFILAVDGSQEVPLVQHPAHDSDPLWSADGSHVLFRSNRTLSSSLWAIPVKNGRPAGEAFLVKADVPIGRPLGPQMPATMTRSGAFYYTVSRPGVNVYHVALGPDGKAAGEPRIATNHDENNDCCAAVSPDGKRLAYYSRSPRVLVIRELATGSEQEFRLNLEINFLLSTGPQWFPDGRSVMVHGRTPQQNGNRQYRVDLSTGRAALMNTKGISVHSRLSPDGQAILQGAGPLRWQDVAGGEFVPVQQSAAGLSPTISPDGKHIAYWQFSEEPRISNIVVANRNGTDARVVCACEFPGTLFPQNVLTWMPDQRHLVYAGADGALWRVSVNGGQPERLSAALSARGPSVQPDGHGLYFTAASASSPAELWVLENFLPGR